MSETAALEATTRQLRTLVDGTVRLQIDFEPNDRVKAMTCFGEPGTPIAIALMDLKNVNRDLEEKPKREKPWQEKLYLSSFFRKPKVWLHVGTDEEFLDWIRKQKCMVCKKEPVEAAHVRRVANGAGMGVKPKYSAIPLCREHHAQQHQKGESAIGGKEMMDKWRIEMVHRWCWETVKSQIGKESWSDMIEEDLVGWCDDKGIDDEGFLVSYIFNLECG